LQCHDAVQTTGMQAIEIALIDIFLHFNFNIINHNKKTGDITDVSGCHFNPRNKFRIVIAQSVSA
jgi:hypothetical protein